MISFLALLKRSKKLFSELSDGIRVHDFTEPLKLEGKLVKEVLPNNFHIITNEICVLKHAFLRILC